MNVLKSTRVCCTRRARYYVVAPAAAAAGAAAAVSGRERGLVCLSAPTRLAQGCWLLDSGHLL